MDCTDLEKHEIKVTDDEPFEERFQRIPPPIVDEVHSHLKESWNWVQLAHARVHGTMMLC